MIERCVATLLFKIVLAEISVLRLATIGGAYTLLSIYKDESLANNFLSELFGLALLIECTRLGFHVYRPEKNKSIFDYLANPTIFVSTTTVGLLFIFLGPAREVSAFLLPVVFLGLAAGLSTAASNKNNLNKPFELFINPKFKKFMPSKHQAKKRVMNKRDEPR